VRTPHRGPLRASADQPRSTRTSDRQDAGIGIEAFAVDAAMIVLPRIAFFWRLPLKDAFGGGFGF